MKSRQLHALLVSVLIGTAALVAPRALAEEPVDLDAVSRFKEAGLERSEVKDVLSFLTDVYGPRLTNSPQMFAAAEWAVGRLTEWKLDNVRREPWGTFGRGWSNERLVLQVVSPSSYPLLGIPRAWTPGTDGLVTADAVTVVVTDEKEMAEWAGKLKGKIVLASRVPVVRPHVEANSRRYSDADLAEMEQQRVTAPQAAFSSGTGDFARKRLRFFAQEGVVAVLEPGTGRGDHGSVHVTGSSAHRRAEEEAVPPQITVASEHYGRVARTLERNVPVRIELDVRNRFYDDTLEAFNLLAEIPGGDKADEVVLLGAHFDSWHAGTGATDNAAGVAAAMEAMRILKTVGLPMRRTVRLALWTGEEQGLLGSRAYVRQHFAERATMTLTPEHARVSAYFNLDNGTGAIRGVYLQGNEAIRPVFNAWMEPFRSLGMTTLTIRNTGSTDHIPFDEVGLPGFQFVQDPVEYFTYSHHSSMDVYDRVQLEDVMKNAVILASFAFHAANRDDLLPRKALPKPRRETP